jgi:hypothetical protein
MTFVEHDVLFQFVDLGNRADVAGAGLIDLLMLLPLTRSSRPIFTDLPSGPTRIVPPFLIRPWWIRTNPMRPTNGSNSSLKT